MSKDFNLNYLKKKEVIIDAGPLLLLLTLKYIESNNIIDGKLLLTKAYSKFSTITNSIESWNEFFEHFDKFYTTSHVIGELFGLVKSRLSLKENQNDFWLSCINFIKAQKLTENYIELLEVSNDSFCNHLISEIGFVDTELIKLAKKNGMPILTIDERTLKTEAEKLALNVILIQDDIYQFINYRQFYK